MHPSQTFLAAVMSGLLVVLAAYAVTMLVVGEPTVMTYDEFQRSW